MADEDWLSKHAKLLAKLENSAQNGFSIKKLTNTKVAHVRTVMFK